MPNGNGKVRPLIFDPEFDKRPLPAQIDYLKKLAASQNHALDLMQQERNVLAVENKILKEQVGNAEQAFHIQKDIVNNLITQNNAEKQMINDRINELETRIKAQDAVIEGFNGNKH